MNGPILCSDPFDMELRIIDDDDNGGESDADCLL